MEGGMYKGLRTLGEGKEQTKVERGGRGFALSGNPFQCGPWPRKEGI